MAYEVLRGNVSLDEGGSIQEIKDSIQVLGEFDSEDAAQVLMAELIELRSLVVQDAEHGIYQDAEGWFYWIEAPFS